MIISMKEGQTYLETFVHDHDGFIELLLYKKKMRKYISQMWFNHDLQRW